MVKMDFIALNFQKIISAYWYVDQSETANSHQTTKITDKKSKKLAQTLISLEEVIN